MQMITVGEETGELDAMLFEIAEMYEREVDQSIKGLSAAIEPVLLAIISALMLVLALAPACTAGRLLLQIGKADPVALEVCLHHHEKVNGSGYPEGLTGDDISLFAKMGAVCDVYDAITSNRPYKSGWDPAESLRKMAEWAEGHFDQRVFQGFVKILGIYPVGSLLRLTSGRIGVVVEQTTKSLTTPRVKVFFSTRSNMRILPEVVDLSLPGCTDKIASREDPDRWRFPDLNELWSGLPNSHW